MADTKITFEQINGELHAPFPITGAFDFNIDTSSFTVGNGASAYTVPVTDGTSGQILQTDGAGVVSFVTPTGITDTNFAINDLTLTGVRVHDFALNDMMWTNVSGFSMLGNNGAVIDMNNGDAVTIKATSLLTIEDPSTSTGIVGQALLADGAAGVAWGNIIDSLTPTNGLSKAANDIKLGGTLIENTIVDGDSNTYDLTFSAVDTFGVTSNLVSIDGTTVLLGNTASAVSIGAGGVVIGTSETTLSARSAVKELRIETPNVISATAINNQFLQLQNAVTGEAEWVTSSGASTASNGLTDVGGDIQLGGILTGTTTVDTSTFNLFWDKVSPSTATATVRTALEEGVLLGGDARSAFTGEDTASLATAISGLVFNSATAQMTSLTQIVERADVNKVATHQVDAGIIISSSVTDGTDTTGIELRASSIDVTFSGAADLQINSNPGVVDQVVTSNGPGLAPSWKAAASKFLTTLNRVFTYSFGGTTFYGRDGEVGLEVSHTYDWGQDIEVDRIGIFIEQNTFDAVTTLTLRKNGVGTVLTATIPAGTIGYFVGTTSPAISYNPTDTCIVEIDSTVSTLGSIRIGGFEFGGTIG